MSSNVKLQNKLITINDFPKIQHFKCGNTSIENFLKQEAYYLTITKKCSTTLVFNQTELVGFFSLRKSTLQVESKGKLLNFPCLDIARIATSEAVQNKGYGTAMIEKIFEVAHTVNERYITLEALIEHYHWYSKRNFIPLIEEEAMQSNQHGLVFMMADLYDEKLVDLYFDE